MRNIIFFCPFIFDGGLEKTLQVYANYFSNNYNVFVVTNCNYSLNIKFSKKVKVINPRKKFFFNSRYLNNFFCIYLIFKNFKRNSIIFSMQDHIFVLITKIFYKKKFKYILRTANPIINNKNTYEQRNYSSKYKLIKKLTTLIYKLSDAVITYSTENKLYLSKFLNKKKIHVIYNHFKLKKKISRKINKKIFNIFFIGRLTEDKNPIFFLKNLIKLNSTMPIKAYVVGKGALSKEIKKIYKENLNLGKYYGFRKLPFDLFLKKIDIFCVTSKYDGTPNVLGEALSHGIPVVAPKNVGLANMVLKNGKYGYLYNPEKKNCFQSKIISIIKNYKHALSKGEMGRKSLSRFDENNTLKKLEKIIFKL